MRFAMLGSGSRGNSTLVEAGTCRVMIDCLGPNRVDERQVVGH